MPRPTRMPTPRNRRSQTDADVSILLAIGQNSSVSICRFFAATPSRTAKGMNTTMPIIRRILSGRSRIYPDTAGETEVRCAASCRRTTLFPAVQAIAQVLAGLENGTNFFATLTDRFGSWIAARPRFSRFDGKRTEATKLDPVAARSAVEISSKIVETMRSTSRW